MNPFAQTMTPPFTGELWRAARERAVRRRAAFLNRIWWEIRENNLSSGVESRHAPKTDVRSSDSSSAERNGAHVCCDGWCKSTETAGSVNAEAGVASGLLNSLPEAEDPRGIEAGQPAPGRPRAGLAGE